MTAEERLTKLIDEANADKSKWETSSDGYSLTEQGFNVSISSSGKWVAFYPADTNTSIMIPSTDAPTTFSKLEIAVKANVQRRRDAAIDKLYDGQPKAE